VRAERLAERTEANVATASTRVLAAAASEESVTKLVIGRSLTAVRGGYLR
jgi:K+-sensing histidine kinase KdpD